MKSKTDSNIFDACIRILLESRGFRINKHNLGRELIVTFTRGNYDTPSSVVIEVNGSPTCGRAILIIKGSTMEAELFSEDPLNPPHLLIEGRNQRLTKVRSDSPKILIFCRLANIAYRSNKDRAVMLRLSDNLFFFENTCDSGNFGRCDSVTVSHKETENLDDEKQPEK